MPNILDLADQLLSGLFVGNLYSDTKTFRSILNSQSHQLPDGAFGHIPNADPRLLNLQPPDGFDHPHDKIAKEQERRVIPPDPMHNTYGQFVGSPNSSILPQKRGEIYGASGIIPKDISSQTDALATNSPPPPSEMVRRMQRGEIYNAHPPPSFGDPIPGGTISGVTSGIVPPSVRQQLNQVRNNQTPPPVIRDLERSEIYNGVPPNDPTQQSINLRDGIEPPSIPENMSRGKIYGPSNTPPQSISKQSDNLLKNTPPPPGPTGGIDNTEIRKLNRSEIYPPNLAPQESIQKLIDFHKAVHHPPTPTFASQKRKEDVEFPPLSPVDAGPTQIVGNQVKNEFINSPERPLNFRDVDDAPSRASLVARQHPQHFGWNASGQEPTAQRHGMIEDNRYDNSDVPFEGNYQSYFKGVPAQLNYFNVFATAHWLRNIADELFVPDLANGFPKGQQTSTDTLTGQPEPEGIVKGISFVATQLLLTAFNPANAENNIGNAIWNPLSIGAAIPLVGSVPFTNITVASAAGLNYKDNVMGAEKGGFSRMLSLREGTYSETSPLHRLSKFQLPISEPGYIGDLTSVGSEDNFDKQLGDNLPTTLSTVQAQVDREGPLGDIVDKAGIHTNLYTPEDPYHKDGKFNPLIPLDKLKDLSSPTADGKMSALFDGKPFPGGGSLPKSLSEVGGALIGAVSEGIGLKPKEGVYTYVRKPGITPRGFSQESLNDAPGVNAALVSVGLPTENNETGLVETNPISDNQIYMPLMFQDLRDPTETFLYFRAFLKGDINETFTPEWNSERFYGRVDQIPVYKGTNRTLNFSFDVAAFSPVDLSLMWTKLKKLQSLVYPTYDTSGFMEAGPLIRLRIGDLFAGENKRGLPGFINGMDWSFPDGIWNTDTDFKIPRLVTVAISFTVVHDGNPGIYPLRQWDVDANGEPTNITEGRTFGTARIEDQGDGSARFKISEAEIRKIFSPNRNIN